MRRVDDFSAIRRLHREGLSVRTIARQLGVSRNTVRKALGTPEPKPYTLAVPRPAPVFDTFECVRRNRVFYRRLGWWVSSFSGDPRHASPRSARPRTLAGDLRHLA